MEIIRSPLPYQGFKTNLLPQLLPHFPKGINRFVEPFTGGCNVGVNVDCKSVSCNELIPEVVNFFRFLQVNSISDILSYLDDRMVEFGLSKSDKGAFNRFCDHYNGIRYLDRHPLDFYLLVCHSFSNLISLNRHQFKAGFGERTFNSSLRKRLIVFHERLHGIDICFFNNNIFNSSFSRDITVEPGDYVYCDPPYSLTMASYNKSWIMNRDDRKLCGILDGYNDQGIYWGQSNFMSYGDEVNTVLKRWVDDNNYRVINIDAEYNMAKKGVMNNEVFITNYDGS